MVSCLEIKARKAHCHNDVSFLLHNPYDIHKGVRWQNDSSTVILGWTLSLKCSINSVLKLKLCPPSSKELGSVYLLRSTAYLFSMDQRLLQNPVGFNMHQSHRILWCSLRSWQVYRVHGANVNTEIWLALAGPTTPATASARVAWACRRVRDKQMLPPASRCQPRDQRSATRVCQTPPLDWAQQEAYIMETLPRLRDLERFNLYEGTRSFQTLYRSTGRNIAASERVLL